MQRQTIFHLISWNMLFIIENIFKILHLLDFVTFSKCFNFLVYVTFPNVSCLKISFFLE